MEIEVSLRATEDLKKERDDLVARLQMITSELKKREEQGDKKDTSSEEPGLSGFEEPKANEVGADGDVIGVSQKPSDPNSRSRLSQDFIMQEILGKGSFGLVRKAKSRLDGILYAVKMVSLEEEEEGEEIEDITKELKVLAELNHENVVRYHTSWIETSAVIDQDDQSGTVSSTSLTTSEPRSVLESNSEDRELTDDKNKSSSDGVDVIFQKSVEYERSEKSIKPVLQETLHIQTEFCAKTLRQVIDDELYKDVDRVWRLFREAVQGMAYCHKKGILHRDLKPENIFITDVDHVKVGDFGLATKSLNAASAVKSSGLAANEQHTSDVGTLSYMSPEMMSGSPNPKVKIPYSNKVDVFSMGIIFFEMCFRPLPPSMERSKIIGDLKSEGIDFPADFYGHYSDPSLEIKDQESMICWMLNHDPDRRPSFNQILLIGTMPSNDKEHAQYNQSVGELAAVVSKRLPNKAVAQTVRSIINKLSQYPLTLEWVGNQFLVKSEYVKL